MINIMEMGKDSEQQAKLGRLARAGRAVADMWRRLDFHPGTLTPEKEASSRRMQAWQGMNEQCGQTQHSNSEPGESLGRLVDADLTEGVALIYEIPPQPDPELPQ